MAPDDEMPRTLIDKVGGLVLIILSFLLMAAGYRYAQSWYVVAGVVCLAVGAALLVRKIVRRNRNVGS